MEAARSLKLPNLKTRGQYRLKQPYNMKGFYKGGLFFLMGKTRE